MISLDPESLKILKEDLNSIREHVEKMKAERRARALVYSTYTNYRLAEIVRLVHKLEDNIASQSTDSELERLTQMYEQARENCLQEVSLDDSEGFRMTSTDIRDFQYVYDKGISPSVNIYNKIP